jgi:Mlc titration factor MtfA (ptsG expression regulator)
MLSAFNQLRADASRDRPTILDSYGATNPAEFFAVCVELFFMQPLVMRWRHPELFEVLACVFRQGRKEHG